MEAHDGLSAAISARAGFKALWASGLSISSSLGYRDANEASWTQVVDVVERMADASGLPILVDGDSGFGNFNNARLLATKLQQRGASGVCLEDKGFPKMNSFIGNRHPLADIDEFSGRLRAVKDAVPEMVLVARIEALIAGYGLEEALVRAHAYADAGADAILIHSRKSDAAEILEFSKQWGGKLPVVIVPTKYYKHSLVSVHWEARISTVYLGQSQYAGCNQAMRATCGRILSGRKHCKRVEPDVATLEKFSASCATTSSRPQKTVIFRNTQVPERSLILKAACSTPFSMEAHMLCAQRTDMFKSSGTAVVHERGGKSRRHAADCRSYRRRNLGLTLHRRLATSRQFKGHQSIYRYDRI
nr:isocitrate lyase/phosphoenolpyruvate mutase family protein [Agrobacterium tumefaciens]